MPGKKGENRATVERDIDTRKVGSPKIRTRTLPHPEFDEETKGLMEEAGRLKILLSLNINYHINRKRFCVEVCEKRREN